MLTDKLERLQAITAGCRPDMHEPDECGVRITEIRGDYLDNAMPAGIGSNCGEIQFFLESDDLGAWFSLADVIALARRAQL